MTLLVLLNLIIRIPSIPHEKGWDSFYIHSLANSVTTYGSANWWWNWLSVFGLYPYSYASAIPFSVSGMAQLTGLTDINMEKTILLFSIMLGLLSIFSVYILAGIIYKDFLFKYLMALFFSISQGIMIYSTWEISTRGPFMIFLPIFLFVLLSKVKSVKRIFLLLILGLFLALTHHYYFFLIPLTVLFLLIKILFNTKLIEFDTKISYLYFIALITVFILPFFLRKLIETGSRYDWLKEILITNTRYVGPLIFFILGGIVYLVFKNNKKFEEWYFLSILILFIPFSYNLRYGPFILLLFLIFFLTISFRNLFYLANLDKNKLVILVILTNILLFVSFSGFYNHERTGLSKSYWYMPENTYSTGVFGNEYVRNNSIVFGSGYEVVRIRATSNGHLMAPQINISNIETIEISPYSSDFYFEGPYVSKSGTTLSGLISWLLELNDVDSSGANNIIKGLNIKYFIDDRLYDSEITNSIQNKKNKVFSNGRFNIWQL